MPARNVKKVVYRKRQPKKRATMRRKSYAESIPRDPFPKTKNCTLVYKNPSSVLFQTSATFGYESLRVMNNGMFDFDTSNLFGNKQPLYFDQLCSGEGPYTHYKVYAWKTTFKVLNVSNQILNVWFDPHSTSAFDADTPLEMNNRPGVQYKMLTTQANASPSAIFTKYTTLASVVGKNQVGDQGYSGTYGANPANVNYSTILVGNAIPGTLTVSDTLLSVTHTFYCQFYNRDSLVSS